METNFDCIVIGAGPAGLSAALNLRQRGKTVLVVHSGETLLAKAEQVDNYLGMPGLSGKQMMERFTQHARDAGAVLRKGRAGNVMPFGGRFMVNLDGDILETGAVVLACGVSKAKPVPGEAELLGRGVSYCATWTACCTAARGSGVGAFPRSAAGGQFPARHRLLRHYIAGRSPTRWKGRGFGRARGGRGGGPPWRPCAWAGPPWSRGVGGPRCPYRAFLSCARPRRRTRWCPALRWKTAL
jgi:thioredoxin reductase (NADPH)